MSVQRTICIVNKDGSHGAPIDIKKPMTFGSSNPANIRIKSKCISVEHAKLDITSTGDVSMCCQKYASSKSMNNVFVVLVHVLSVF